MRFSPKTRKEILKHIDHGMSINTASQRYGVTRQTISRWLKDPANGHYTAKNSHKHIDNETKIEVLRLLESGELTIPQAAALKNVKETTVRGWIYRKSSILAVYSSQRHYPEDTGTETAPGEEVAEVSSPDEKETKQHIRDLKAENEFLKAKVAYLETLMELNGTPAPEFKKKRNTRPSKKSSREESGT